MPAIGTVRRPSIEFYRAQRAEIVQHPLFGQLQPMVQELVRALPLSHHSIPQLFHEAKRSLQRLASAPIPQVKAPAAPCPTRRRKRTRAQIRQTKGAKVPAQAKSAKKSRKEVS